MKSMSKKQKLTEADEEWWVQHRTTRYRWSPDLDLNNFPLVRDPDNRSQASLRRTRLFLDMLLGSGGGKEYLQRARKIIVACPQLRGEYEAKLQARARELRNLTGHAA